MKKDSLREIELAGYFLFLILCECDILRDIDDG